MGKHATRAPSAAKRWLNCPGSIAMSEGCEDHEGSAAREGSFAHDIGSRALDEGKDAADFIGEVSECKEFEWDEARAEALQIYIDTVNDMTFMADRVKTEQKVVFSEDNWGTSDIVAVTGRTLDIIDLKFGTFYVDVRMNEQLLDYACCALVSLDWLPDDIDTVRLTIVQPRHHNEEDLVRTVSMTVGEVRMWQKKVLEPGLEDTHDPKARLNPGDHCMFCPAKVGKCQAFQGAALVSAQEVFPDGDVEAEPKAPPAPSSLTPARMKAVMDAAPLLREWLKAVEDHAHRRAKAGDKIDGYKLVQAIGNRQYKDEKKAAAALRRSGVDPVVERTLSPNQAQQQLDGSKKENKAFIDALCVRPVRGDKLVLVSDKRPELPGADVFPDSQ